ncbi:hypothetical protein PG988_001753 [Apiospora saccharicola]
MARGFALVAATLFWGNVLAQGCVVSIFTDPSRLGCKPEDKNCACHSGQNLTFGVRDCITQACKISGDELAKQIAASDQYTNEICVPFTSPATTAPAAAPAPTTAEPAKTTGAASPEVKDPPGSSIPATATQAGTTSAANSQPTTGASSAASADSPSGTSNVNAAASSQAAGAAAATASPTSSEAAAKEKDDSSKGGLSIAAKAGIGAGAGVVVVMAAITLCCIMMRRRRDNRNAGTKGPARPARSPLPAISKPVAGGRHYAEDVESPAALNFPFPAACNEKRPHPSAQSPTSPYKSPREDHYSVQGNKYEDMLPRTQPRTMI